MDEKPGRDSTGIVKIADPIEIAFGAEGPFLRRPQKEVPIEVDARLQVGINGLEPIVILVVAGVVDLRDHDLAERAVLHILVGGLVGVVRHALDADLHLHARFANFGDHALGLFHRVGHRLFAIDVLAGAGRIDGHLAVPVIGRGDDDNINVLVRQEFTVVLIRPAAGQLRRLLRALVEHVADRVDLDFVGLLHLEQRVDVSPDAPAAAADDAHAKPVGWRLSRSGRKCGSAGEFSSRYDAHVVFILRSGAPRAQWEL